MKKKEILILGGTSDIGIAIANRFAQDQFDVHLAGRDSDYLARVATDINIRRDVHVKHSVFDATEFNSHDDFYSSISEKPEICACVFGYLGNQNAAQELWSEANKIIGANYTGAVSILNRVAEDYARVGSGTIIGISSVAGDRGRQSNYIYGSAKAGFTAYLSGLRNRLYNKGVNVITVKPGFVRTRMTDGLHLPAALTVSAEKVAESVYQAFKRKKDVVYISALWWPIMTIISMLPEALFKRLKL